MLQLAGERPSANGGLEEAAALAATLAGGVDGLVGDVAAVADDLVRLEGRRVVATLAGGSRPWATVAASADAWRPSPTSSHSGRRRRFAAARRESAGAVMAARRARDGVARAGSPWAKHGTASPTDREREATAGAAASTRRRPVH